MRQPVISRSFQYPHIIDAFFSLVPAPPQNALTCFHSLFQFLLSLTAAFLGLGIFSYIFSFVWHDLPRIDLLYSSISLRIVLLPTRIHVLTPGSSSLNPIHPLFLLARQSISLSAASHIAFAHLCNQFLATQIQCLLKPVVCDQCASGSLRIVKHKHRRGPDRHRRAKLTVGLGKTAPLKRSSTNQQLPSYISFL